ncbi:MAG: endonuclease Q family protein [Microgenomates group bacterium]
MLKDFMEIVADLHLHSKYSRAVSQQMVLSQMAKWAKLKGIDLLGTGDFTHPLWLSEIKNSLEEKDGVLELKEKKDQGDQKNRGETKFLLTAEISSIYSQGGKTRKIHNLIIAPSFATAEKICSELKKRGCNLISDGRPIVGLSAKNILELILGIDDDCLLIPCHIWTPWFSLFGSESGFDSLEECFGNCSRYIYAVETGLSSDPEMNWQVEDLDNRSIVSFSDAHSPRNLGRESTVLQVQSDSSNLKINYRDVISALRGKGESDWEIGYTIEFYPEEGKYHYTGHRNCGVVQSPEETEKRGTTCPVCGRRLTVGVMERVRKLGRQERVKAKGEVDETGTRWIKGKTEGLEGKERTPFVKLVPLEEIIAESLGVGAGSKKVEGLYFELIEKLGSEIEILTKRDLDKIKAIGGEKLAEGILKVRSGDIFIKPGFDGEYGKVAVWGRRGKEDKENKEERKQMGLF